MPRELIGDGETVQQARECRDFLHVALGLVEDVELRAVASEVDGPVTKKRREPAVSFCVDEIYPPARVFEHIATLLFGYELAVLVVQEVERSHVDSSLHVVLVEDSLNENAHVEGNVLPQFRFGTVIVAFGSPIAVVARLQMG